MKYKRYSGEFLSVAGIRYRCEIWQEAQQAFPSVGTLTFPGEEELVIQWPETSKEDIICGSSAILRIVSPSDRTYADLYTIEPAAIRLDVYRDDSLYWSGALDPEFYEEPYESASDYEVSLTFSDFGILDRLKYNLSGAKTLHAILTDALSRTGMAYNAIDCETLCSTYFIGGAKATLPTLSVRSENFYDEEGEASTLKEAIEAILRPLALRMVQKAGKVWIYDLNGLHEAGASGSIYWTSTSQTMGTDKVVNNVRVTFSPYGDGEILTGETDYRGKADADHINASNQNPESYSGDYGEYYSFYPDLDEKHKVGGVFDTSLLDFTIFLSANGRGGDIGTGCKWFRIFPLTGGSESTGVAYALRGGLAQEIGGGLTVWKLHQGVGHPDGTLVLRSKRAWLPALTAYERSLYRLKVCQEILIDARYNPLSGSTDGNEKSNDNTLKTCSAFVFIPARITIYDENGTALYHYSNRSVAAGAVSGHMAYSGGTWASGADTGGDCWFEYYNPDDLEQDTGIRGWKGNRQCIGRPDGKSGRVKADLYDSFKKMPDGEFLPYPPAGGYIEVAVYAGILGYDYGQSADECSFGSTDSQWDKKNIYENLRWALYKLPSVEVVKKNLIYESADCQDVEYTGVLNPLAKDELELDTTVGTADDILPTAKGLLLTAAGTPIENLVRGGVTDRPERLLIGTLYSQFADRKTKLSGEAAIIPTAPAALSEDNQGDKLFMAVAETQDCQSDCGSATFVELSPDEYEAIEEVEDD